LLLIGNSRENITNVRTIDAMISRGKAYPAALLADLLRAIPAGHLPSRIFYVWLRPNAVTRVKFLYNFRRWQAPK
jgi:hypothetical protein